MTELRKRPQVRALVRETRFRTVMSVASREAMVEVDPRAARQVQAEDEDLAITATEKRLECQVREAAAYKRIQSYHQARAKAMVTSYVTEGVASENPEVERQNQIAYILGRLSRIERMDLMSVFPGVDLHLQTKLEAKVAEVWAQNTTEWARCKAAVPIIPAFLSGVAKQ